MYKKFCLILLCCFALVSCGNYLVGEVMGVARGSGAIMPFSYHRGVGDDMIIKGKSASNEVYEGKIYTTYEVRKIEKGRYPHIPMSVIKEKNNFGYAKLTGNAGGEFQCFFKQKSPRKFNLGGEGICYGRDRSVIDLTIKKHTVAGDTLSEWFYVFIEAF